MSNRNRIERLEKLIGRRVDAPLSSVEELADDIRTLPAAIAECLELPADDLARFEADCRGVAARLLAGEIVIPAGLDGTRRLARAMEFLEDTTIKAAADCWDQQLAAANSATAPAAS